MDDEWTVSQYDGDDDDGWCRSVMVVTVTVPVQDGWMDDGRCVRSDSDDDPTTVRTDSTMTMTTVSTVDGRHGSGDGDGRNDDAMDDPGPMVMTVPDQARWYGRQARCRRRCRSMTGPGAMMTASVDGAR